MSYQASRGRLLLRVMVCLSLAGLAAPALGGVINFSVVYSDPEFGTPQVSGNSLLCSPLASATGFVAQAIAPNSFGFVDGYLEVDITALQGGNLGALHVYEWGAYTLMGVGTAATQVAVSTPVGVTILAVDGNTLSTPIDIPPRMVPFSRPSSSFPPKPGGQYNLVQDAGVGVAWVGDLTLNLNAELASHQINGVVTKVKVALDNVLFAQNEAASIARIDKKGFRIDILVPEPSTLLLLICGLGAAILSRGRRD
jgi:hypothetical protein